MIAMRYQGGTVIRVSGVEHDALIPYLDYSDFLCRILADTTGQSYSRWQHPLNYISHKLHLLRGHRVTANSETIDTFHACRKDMSVQAGGFTTCDGPEIGYYIAISSTRVSNVAMAPVTLSNPEWTLLDNRLSSRPGASTPTGHKLACYLGMFLTAPSFLAINSLFVLRQHLNFIEADWSRHFPSIFAPPVNLTPWVANADKLLSLLAKDRSTTPAKIAKLLDNVVEAK